MASTTPLAPMRFVRVRADDAACRPDCPEWISAEGKIVRGTADALERVTEALADRRLPIFINSAGGSVQDAMAMGRLIRARRLAVVVARTDFAPCPASARNCGEAKGSAESWGAYCASACTLVLAGGVERYVSPLSFVGVHQMTEIVSQTQIKRLYAVHYFVLGRLRLELSRTFVGERRSTATRKRTADKGVDDSVRRYLAEMGVLDPVMKLTLATPAKDVRWLTAEELVASRLATVWVDDDSPMVVDAGASGLRGQPTAAEPGAVALFATKSLTPLARPVADRPATLEVSFAYRRGGAAALATFLVRDAASGAPLDWRGAAIAAVLDPEGVELRAAAPGAGEPAQATIPLASFCRLQHGGRALVSLVEAGPQPAAAPAGEPWATIDLAAGAGAEPLFDEACPPSATASR